MYRGVGYQPTYSFTWDDSIVDIDTTILWEMWGWVVEGMILLYGNGEVMWTRVGLQNYPKAVINYFQIIHKHLPQDAT